MNARPLKNRIHANHHAPRRSAGGTTRDILAAVRELTGAAAPNDQIAALREMAEQAEDAEALAGELAAVTIHKGKSGKKSDDEDEDQEQQTFDRDDDDDDDDDDGVAHKVNDKIRRTLEGSAPVAPRKPKASAKPSSRITDPLVVR